MINHPSSSAQTNQKALADKRRSVEERMLPLSFEYARRNKKVRVAPGVVSASQAITEGQLSEVSSSHPRPRHNPKKAGAGGQLVLLDQLIRQGYGIAAVIGDRMQGQAAVDGV